MESRKQREDEQVEQVAREYESRGYTVERRVKLDTLLPGAPSWEADFVASKNGERVIVEVKSGRNPAHDDQWIGIREILRRTPEWRFDLVIAPESDDERMGGSVPFTESEVEAAFVEAAALAEAKHIGAAFLLAWSGVEGRLRLTAERNGIPHHVAASPARLIDSLASEGILESEERDELVCLMRLRNGLAHGFSPPKLDASEVERLVEVASRIAERETRQPAKSA